MVLLRSLATNSVRPSVFLAPLGVWGVMAVLAVLNGGFRDVVLIPVIAGIVFVGTTYSLNER